jgi:hypothetical protein
VQPEPCRWADREEVRAPGLDQRFNHWTVVRNGLMNAHADLFPQLPHCADAAERIDQMKLFELVQIVPSPTPSGKFADYRISDPRIWPTYAITASSLRKGGPG